MSDARVGVGVVIVGHGRSATALVDAAREVLGSDALADVIAIDAGPGRTEELDRRVCVAVETADGGRGVLLLADLLGSSPCQCVVAGARSHDVELVTGVNLATLLKLATLDRDKLSLAEVGHACAESTRKAVVEREVPGEAPK
jgi:PTS system mannose-specific IIA component